MALHPPPPSWQGDPISARDGTPLFRHRWAHPQAKRTPVLLIHGLGEHLGRYHHVATALLEAGHPVTGIDLRGHGRSGGRRVFVRRWQDYLDDLDLVAPAQPYWLIAHSMGALVALDFLRAASPAALRSNAMALSGPLLKVAIRAPWWKLLLAKQLSRFWPTLRLASELPPEAICSDPAVVADYRHDHLNSAFATPRWFTEMTAALDRIHRVEWQDRLPLCMHYGGDDQIVAVDAIEDFATRWGSTASTRCWPDGRHEVFNEPFGLEVVAEMLAWSQSALSNSSSSTE